MISTIALYGSDNTSKLPPQKFSYQIFQKEFDVT